MLVRGRIGVIVVVPARGRAELVRDAGHPRGIVARRGGWIGSAHRSGDARQQGDHGEHHAGAAESVTHGRMEHPTPHFPVYERATIDWD